MEDAYVQAGQILESVLGEPWPLPVETLTLADIEEISGACVQASLIVRDQTHMHREHRAWIVAQLSLASKYLTRYAKGEER